MFQLTTIDLGEVKVGSENKVKFPYNKDIQTIKSTVADCGCTNVVHDIGNRIIGATFIPNPIPVHLAINGVKEVKKELGITVSYLNTDGTSGEQKLYIKAIVKN